MFCIFFFFKQKPAYDMRISDWSSDVALPICNVGWKPSPRTGIACLAIFTAFLVVLPVLASTAPALRLSNIFYRAGSLVFGGGHVQIGRAPCREGVCRYV